MTRLSALLMVLTAFAFGAVAQTTPPTPHDPEIWEWIDYYDSSQPDVFMSAQAILDAGPSKVEL